MRKTMIAGVIGLLALLALAGPALGERHYPDGSTEGVDVGSRPVKKDGTPLGPWKVTHDAPESGREVAPGQQRTVMAAGDPSGCREWWAERYKKDLYGFTVYRLRHNVAWCWNYPRIVSLTRTPTTQALNSCCEIESVAKTGIGWIYRFNNSQGGNRRKLTWAIANYEPLHRWIVGRMYPWVEIDVSGNGYVNGWWSGS